MHNFFKIIFILQMFKYVSLSPSIFMNLSTRPLLNRHTAFISITGSNLVMDMKGNNRE